MLIWNYLVIKENHELCTFLEFKIIFLNIQHIIYQNIFPLLIAVNMLFME